MTGNSAALALPPCRISSGVAAGKTAPDRREARFLFPGRRMTSRGDVFHHPTRHASPRNFLYI